jgi:hypothetical protein
MMPFNARFLRLAKHASPKQVTASLCPGRRLAFRPAPAFVARFAVLAQALLSAIGLIFCPPFVPWAEARWAEPAEAPYAVNRHVNRFIVRRDGTYSLETEHQVEILKDSARLDRGLFRVTFDARASRFRLLSAKTINGAKTLEVDKRHVEIKPLASAGDGFDETRQATIAFPEVNIGSKLYSHFIREVKEPQVPGYFAVNFPIGIGDFVQAFDVSFSSEAPLYFETYDPKGIISAESGRKGQRYWLRFLLKKPIYRGVVEENNVVFDPQAAPWIGVSTAKDWSALPRQIAEGYEREISAPLPASFAGILEKARGKTTDVERIDAVTSELQGQLRYVGDWIPVKGAFFPRSLKEVERTGFGDCKDFATATVAILRRLGFDARVAWVMRGRTATLSPLRLAALDFNHAIALAAKGGQERWIDPTNLTSYAKAIYPDIADRPSLVISRLEPELRRTPAMSAGEGEASIVTNLKFKGDGEIDAAGDIALRGRAALSMAGTSLSYSKQQIDFMLISWIANAGNLAAWSFDRDDFSSRVASDYKSGFAYRERWRPLQTSEGVGHLIPIAPVAGLLDFRRDLREAGVELSDPSLWHREQRIAGRPVALKKPTSCSGKSEWIDYSRRFERDGEQIVVIDEVLTKKPAVPASAIKSPEFAALQDGVEGCLREAAVVFKL